ncbi:hypothetical protein BSNN_37470 [Bacillus subtilis subsp. natto]|nr:hypothetical protein BSNT_10201 [Bacillus subtilis subsp. natto BEST195]BEH07714.1 hypothetical protein BSNN_37470 [Bacillus subtilis subsp. natto]
MFKVFENNVKTNLTFNYQWDIQSGFKEARSKVIQHELKYDGTKINESITVSRRQSSLYDITDQLKESLNK